MPAALTHPAAPLTPSIPQELPNHCLWALLSAQMVGEHAVRRGAAYLKWPWMFLVLLVLFGDVLCYLKIKRLVSDFAHPTAPFPRPY
jgi:hypothetical protein